jgi:hypothetical protein
MTTGKGGLDLPSPDDLNSTQLSKKLRVVIQSMSLLSVFLYNTDHLSDRQLYEVLWHDLLREEGYIECLSPNSAYDIDIIGSGSEEDFFIFLKYYADEKERTQSARDFPQENFPAHEHRPYDRDRHLPQRQEQVEGQC